MFGNSDLPLFKEWLINKKILQPSSIKTYIDSVSRFLATNPNVYDLEDYNNFIIKYAIKKRCGHYYSALKAFIEYKVTDANLKNRMIENLICPPERNNIIRERRHLNDKQILEVINYLKKYKHQIVALIQKLTGVRAGEILKLKRGSILTEEYQGREVTRINILGKRNKRNIVYIHFKDDQKIIWDYITTYPTYGDYYFIELGSMKGRAGNIDDANKLVLMNYHWFWEDLKQALQTAGIDKKDFATHDFRRCFARKLWEKDKDLYKLQNALNHKDPKTTLRYLDQSGLKNIDTFYEMQKPDTK